MFKLQAKKNSKPDGNKNSVKPSYPALFDHRPAIVQLGKNSIKKLGKKNSVKQPVFTQETRKPIQARITKTR